MTSLSPPGPILYLRNATPGLYEYSNDNTAWTSFTFPLVLTNSNAPTLLKVLFTTDFTLTGVSHYIACGSTHIQFGSESLNPDGTRPVITIQNVSNYPGLFQNGTVGTNGYGSISIFNLVVQASGTTTLAVACGWFGQAYFAKGATNNTVLNCSSSGTITQSSGGIIGSSCAINGGSLVIVGCSSSGSLTGEGGGGIVGAGACHVNGTLAISECFSTGSTISNLAGGIIGYSAGINGSVIVISKCYSTGDIAVQGGGICGQDAAAGSSMTITGCYSTGDIGAGAGGICGWNAGTVSVINCYSIGTIGANAGGIFGQFFSGGAVATYCYTSGDGSGQGIYSGLVSDEATNYSERNNGSSSGWSSTRASATLQNVGTSTWISVASETPYELLNFGPSPYTLNTVNLTKDGLTHSYSQTVPVGTPTNGTVSAGYTFSIVAGGDPSLSIDSASGIVTPTVAGSYTLTVRASFNPYTITTFVLTVTGSPEPPPTPVSTQPSIPQQYQNIHLRSGNDIVPYSVGAVIPPAIPPIPARTIQNIKLPNGPKDVACNTAARCHPTHVYKNVPNPTDQPSNPGQQRICNIQPPRKVSGTALQQYQPGYGTYTVTYNRPSGSKVAGTWPPPSIK